MAQCHRFIYRDDDHPALLMAFHQYAPFGNNSFAQVDAHIQYMDFFSYLKHLLDGEARIPFLSTVGSAVMSGPS